MAAQPRTRFYREFLTPALHRRFTRAAGVTFLACYVEAVVIGEKSSLLWWWFPIGRAGLRTLLLFICSLSIFVLRVGQLHFGARNTASPFETFRQYLLRWNTLQTLTFYFFSAWWFSVIYLWSASNGADLGWVAEGRSYERQRLNERPIYLRSVFFMLAFIQTLYHLYYDYDRIVLVVRSVKQDPSISQSPHKVIQPLIVLRTKSYSMAQSAALRSCVISVVGPILYAMLIRRMAWNFTMFFARLLWNLSKASEPSVILLYSPSLIFRSASSGFLLVGLWELPNTVFSAYVAQAPLKRGAPLTDDSRDPNGSLLNGLKSRKETIKTFAFWELVYVSQVSELRRRSIFSDIDRSGGAAWSQVLDACLGTLQGITGRIKDFQNLQSSAPRAAQRQQNTVQSLPRLTTPLKRDQIFVNPSKATEPREMIESTIANVTKSLGQSQQPHQPTLSLSPRTKRYIGTARDKLLTQDQQNAVSPANLTTKFNDQLYKFLRSPFGSPFRQTFRRRACAVVFGTPYGDLTLIVDAIESLTCLAVASLKEDRYGKANKDIPILIRHYINTIASLETFLQQLPVHWTDMKYEENNVEGRRIDEIELVLEYLKRGLRELLVAFDSYVLGLGLGSAELRIGRQYAGIAT